MGDLNIALLNEKTLKKISKNIDSGDVSSFNNISNFCYENLSLTFKEEDHILLLNKPFLDLLKKYAIYSKLNFPPKTEFNETNLFTYNRYYSYYSNKDIFYNFLANVEDQEKFEDSCEFLSCTGILLKMYLTNHIFYNSFTNPDDFLENEKATLHWRSDIINDNQKNNRKTLIPNTIDSLFFEEIMEFAEIEELDVFKLINTSFHYLKDEIFRESERGKGLLHQLTAPSLLSILKNYGNEAKNNNDVDKIKIYNTFCNNLSYLMMKEIKQNSNNPYSILYNFFNDASKANNYVLEIIEDFNKISDLLPKEVLNNKTNVFKFESLYDLFPTIYERHHEQELREKMDFRNLESKKIETSINRAKI